MPENGKIKTDKDQLISTDSLISLAKFTIHTKDFSEYLKHYLTQRKIKQSDLTQAEYLDLYQKYLAQ